GSARAETSVKASARPNTIRITMRRGPLHDTLDDDLSTITIPCLPPPSPWPWSDAFVRLGMRSGTGISRLLDAEGVRNLKPALADSNFGPVCTSVATSPVRVCSDQTR